MLYEVCIDMRSFEAVAESHNGLNIIIASEFLSKPRDMNIDGSRLSQIVHTPDTLKKHLPSKEPAAIFDQKFEEIELLARKRNRSAVKLHKQLFEIYKESPVVVRRGAYSFSRTLQKSYDSRLQLAHAERLRNVVVCAEFESIDLIIFAGTSRKDQDRKA